MLLTIVLWIFAAALLVYIIVSVARTGHLTVEAALAALGIVVTVIFALRTSPPTATSPLGPGASLPPPSNIPATSPPTKINLPMDTPAPPTAPSTPAPSPTQAPPPTPIPAGTVLYQADWSGGMNGWPKSAGWSASNGTLINDGWADEPFGAWENWISAPSELNGLADYAVEAQIEMVSTEPCGFFGVVARGAYVAGMYGCGTKKASIIGTDSRELGNMPFVNDNAKHTYKLEVKGNVIELSIDGAVVVDAKDNKHVESGKAGLYSYGTEIVVYSFRVVSI